MAGMFGSDAGPTNAAANKAFKQNLNKVYKWYTGGFLVFVIGLAILEQMGLPKSWIGFIFLLATIGLYAGIGIMSRTTDAAEYYVAGRRVPAIYNGMATGADWMSAASFIGMAGTLYLTGYGGLAFIMGWTGGYCLVALFLAPYMRKFGQFTVPDFLGERYGGNLPRFLGILAAILCSFTYVVAQIYGVGLITARLTGVAFEIGIFLGLGGILVCSFLGGMRAVTWTQVAQYCVLIIAYLIPAVAISYKITGNPIPQLGFGSQVVPDAGEGQKPVMYLLEMIDKLHRDLGLPEYTKGTKSMTDVLAITLAFVGTTVSEMTAANEGIGYLLVSAGSSMQMGLAFAGLIVVGAMAMVMYELFSAIEKRTTGWARRGSQGE